MKRNLTRAFLLGFLILAAGCASQSLPDPRQMSFAPVTFEVPDVQRQNLPNGVQLYMREDHELPLIEMTALIGAGTIADPAEKTGRSDLLAKLLATGGAGDRAPEELDQTLALMAADLNTAAETYHTTVSLSLRSEDLAEAVAILADLLRRPRFDPARLEVAKRQAIERIRRRDDQPGSLAQRALKQALYPSHPLGRVPTVNTVQAVTREDLVQEHRRFFHPNNLWLGISGDFDPAELERLLTDALGDWRRENFTPQQVPPLGPPPQPAIWVGEKDLPQTTILLGDIGISKDNPDLHAVRVMNFVLGGGGFNSRLMREIRSNRGLAYSAYSYFQVGRRLPGPFVAGSETRSEATAEVVTLIREIMKRMREEKITDEQLQVARESLINSFVFGFTETQEIVNTAMRLDYYAYPPDFLVTYRDRVAAVGAEEVLQAAREYLHPEKLSIVLVGDRRAFAELVRELDLPEKEIPGPEAAGVQ